MSFMDKLKSWFSGGSESAAEHEPAELPADVPPAAVDPLGTPMPGTGTLPPPAADEPDERA